MAWLTSMFPEEEVAPFRNAKAFEGYGGENRRYRLFAGHIMGEQLARLPLEVEIFTILRQPAEMLISRYYKRRKETSEEPELAAFYLEHSLIDAASSGSPLVLAASRDRLTRQLGDGFAERQTEAQLDGLDLAAVRERQSIRASALLERAMLVGDHRDIDGATLLLAAVRGWAAPPPRPRVHDHGAPTARDAVDPAIRAAVDALLSTDNALYEMAQSRIASVRSTLAELCGEATPAAVDALHRKRFFAETPRLIAFSTDANVGWSGAGWGVREVDGIGNRYRQMTSNRATTFLNVRRDVRGGRRVDLAIWHAGSPAALDGLGASVAGEGLGEARREWDGGALTLEWEMPEALIDRCDGQVELAIERAGTGAGDPLWFSGLSSSPTSSANMRARDADHAAR